MYYLTNVLHWVGDMFLGAGDKTIDHPKSSNALAGMAMAALGYWGVDKADVSAVGSLMVQLGKYLGG